MAKYRTTEPVAYVKDGAAVSVDAGREINLTDEQAQSLAGKVLLVESPIDSMFPSGPPIIDPTIVRTVPATPVVGEPVVAVEPVATVSPFVKPAKK